MIRSIFFILLLAILLVPISLTQPQFVNASSKSPYDSGYDHGCDDADISDPDDRYINQPDRGPSRHTNEFMGGYNDGFQACIAGTEDNTYDNNNNATIPETGQTSEDNFVWNTGIILLITLIILAIIIAAIWKLTHRRKKRQYFSTDVKREVLRNQDYKCTKCKKSAGVWDYDHTDGDRSNNDISNCQALCPNCHAKKTRGLLKEEIKSSFKVENPNNFCDCCYCLRNLGHLYVEN